MNYVLGLDLGGSSIKAVTVTPTGHLLAEANVPFVDRDLEWAHKLRTLVADFAAQHNGSAQAIGLAAPGLAAKDGRCILNLPGRLIGIEGLDWTDWLGGSRPIPVINDAHAALLGEVWQGAARGLENVFLLTLGTGVGGAAMVDGHLLKGHLGRAGHFGHTVLDFLGPLDDVHTPGSLEYELGNKNIQSRSGGRFPTTKAVVAAHLGGDPDASKIWLRSVRALAAGIASLVNILDPEAVILGGGVADAGDPLFVPLRTELARVEWRPGGHAVRVLHAQLGGLAGAYGAAWNVIRSASTMAGN